MTDRTRANEYDVSNNHRTRVRTLKMGQEQIAYRQSELFGMLRETRMVVAAVHPRGTIVIKRGATAEIPTIAKAMMLKAFGGNAVVGQQ